MGWEKGRYYTRSRKQNGKVIREYVGCGLIGQMAYELDRFKKQEREAKRMAIRMDMNQVIESSSIVDAYSNILDLLTEEVLVSSGFHRHKGQWRRRRINGKSKEA